MNNKERVFCYIIIGLLTGACICLIVEKFNQAKEKKKSKNKSSKKGKPSTGITKEDTVMDLDPIAEQVVQQEQKKYPGQRITVIKGDFKAGSRSIAQKLMDDQTLVEPETVSDFFEPSKEEIQSKEYTVEPENMIPSQNSDEISPQMESSSKEKKQQKAKITSRRGEEALHKDLKLLTTLNKNGDTYMDEEVNPEFIQNVSAYSSVESTDRMFNLNFLKKETIIRYTYQLCKKHRPDHMKDEEYAAILTDHIHQFSDQSPQSITSYWSRTVRGKKQSYLKNDPYTIFIEP